MHFVAKPSISRAFFLGSLSCLALSARAEQKLPPGYIGTSIPINLTCPSHDDGILDLMFATHTDNSRSNVKVSYKFGIPIRIEYWSADYNQPFVKKVDVVLADELDAKQSEYAQRLINITTPVLSQICLGSTPVRSSYFSQLVENRKRFPFP